VHQQFEAFSHHDCFHAMLSASHRASLRFVFELSEESEPFLLAGKLKAKETSNS